ncbi:hypothetical protein BJ508DRAFT_312514 [Ascobolus immersus RN42]|uniref:Uncharacterized protein n=1 Tax=Ascobolus immersus RN42 TaxID=1160509 RepID=A0A3N4HQQ8_ASCIM|nr:hypothetical protein BJ508DRAFT_312514 [Ascobolus immersus RN42]
MYRYLYSATICEWVDKAPPVGTEASSFCTDAISLCTEASSFCTDAMSLCTEASSFCTEAPPVGTEASSFCTEAISFSAAIPKYLRIFICNATDAKCRGAAIDRFVAESVYTVGGLTGILAEAIGLCDRISGFCHIAPSDAAGSKNMFAEVHCLSEQNKGNGAHVKGKAQMHDIRPKIFQIHKL